jgi:hypothetical protein
MVVMRSKMGNLAATRRADTSGVNWDRSSNLGLGLVQDVDNMIRLIELVLLEEGVEEGNRGNSILLWGDDEAASEVVPLSAPYDARGASEQIARRGPCSCD